MAFPDAKQRAQKRLLALAPFLTQANASTLMSTLRGFLGSDADTNVALSGSAPNINYTTASPGAPLLAKAADNGVQASAGLFAIANVVFFVQAAATATITIPVGTLVGNGGNGTSVPAVFHQTTAVATISSGATNCGAPVPTVCTQPGVLGNVAAGTLVTTNLGGNSGIQVSNATSVNSISNPSGAGVGGVDPDSPGQIQSKIAAAVKPQYGAAALQAAIIAAGAFDAYVADPQAGSGAVYYYWCDSSGNAPTISGGSVTGSGVPDSTNYITGASLSGLAAAVDAALRAVLSVAVIPRIGGAGSASSPFTVTNIASIAYTYSAPAAVQSNTIQPVINAALQAYFQTLLHNQVYSQFGAAQAVQAATGNVLTNFTLTTPSGGAAALTTIYRCTGTPSFTPTRV